MSNTHFQFKQFLIRQASATLKVTTDGCLMGAWVAYTEKTDKVLKVLDIGTGTGLLTLMLAQQLPQATFTALEPHVPAAEEAAENFRLSPWGNLCLVMPVTVQDFQPNDIFDLIVCNPPFFSQNLKSQSPDRNAALHNDTLSFADLAQAIHRLLAPQGKAYVMYPPAEMGQFASIAQDLGLFLTAELAVSDRPSSGIIRKIGCFERSAHKAPSEHLVIKEGNDYSPAFVSLLKDYYLHL